MAAHRYIAVAKTPNFVGFAVRTRWATKDRTGRLNVEQRDGAPRLVKHCHHHMWIGVVYSKHL